ncbi:DUF5681 domain-containing protein [Sphingomonas sp. A2-49]|uniref:DUF5681 domain-containing protein n=1 Tax=Sphingomonas sp. A2-49 TaxID=1391375 RepID=UPI0021D2DF7B|nr:DUF5681 domain-containing protein [Sphingomonas sp. A2-49]MCU6455672.1 DUF5681 domain-containing protein [Sphingomonas sp. A2-49]
MTPDAATNSVQTPASSGSLLRPDIVTRSRTRIRPAAIPTSTGAASPSAAAAGDMSNRASTMPRADGEVPAAPPSDGTSPSYAVGYGRPPRHSQFRKGQSGNLKGRPKGAKSFKTIVRESMTAKLAVRTATGRKTVTHAQALMMQTIESALKGSRQDRHELLRYYRDAIPEDATPTTHALPVTSSEPGMVPEDMDAHDRAILECLRATLLGEIGDEQ